MASESSTRLWRACKAAGRPWPVLCPEDDVVDFMVMEAVYLKVLNLEQADQEKQHIKNWKKQQQEELKKKFGQLGR